MDCRVLKSDLSDFSKYIILKSAKADLRPGNDERKLRGVLSHH